MLWTRVVRPFKDGVDYISIISYFIFLKSRDKIKVFRIFNRVEVDVQFKIIPLKTKSD